MFFESQIRIVLEKGSDDKGIDIWMRKASKILIFFYSLKTKAKAQLELNSYGSYHN